MPPPQRKRWTANMRPPEGVLRAALLLAVLALSSGSHFRYGTISWVPCSNSQASSQCPRISGGIDVSGRSAEFEFQAAFRRNYNWGQYFGEEWSTDGVTFTADPWLTMTDQSIVYDGFDESTGTSLNPYTVKFPVGIGSSQSRALVPAGSERFCDSPLDTGDSPRCGLGQVQGGCLFHNALIMILTPRAARQQHVRVWCVYGAGLFAADPDAVAGLPTA
mmetsp:Transcript_58508/g.186434  ORF Transcript_58508/g.186434 Transcript_58508/m.186434 type:complete len:219 (+) Transcript_58508:253-909(+)